METENVKIGFFDRRRLIERTLFLPSKDLNRRLIDQLSSVVIVISVKKVKQATMRELNPGILSSQSMANNSKMEAKRANSYFTPRPGISLITKSLEELKKKHTKFNL